MKDMKKIEFRTDDQFSTTKYIIKISYEIKGIVSTMDIIGGLFGQTEGLLNDLELRELQKSGRIGRIQVNNSTDKGNSIGEILIPSSLDRVETAILAATIESVDRVGPCSATMQLKEIQDIREEKRKQIMDRAHELLQKWEQETPESAEMSESILEKIRTGELIEYGPEKLAAGEDVETSEQIIIVEGIADVKALMKAGIRNAIETRGTHIPQSVIDLSKKKSTIAFVDGDRGGEMILNELLAVADIDYVAIAPKGVMVEELTRKEILKHLQNKKTVQEFLAERQREKAAKSIRKSRSSRDMNKGSTYNKGRSQKSMNGYPNHQQRQRSSKYDNKRSKSRVRNKSNNEDRGRNVKSKPDHSKINSIWVDFIKSMIASNEAMGIDENMEQVFKVANTQVFNALDSESKAHTLILDGVVTQRLLDKALASGIKQIFAVNFPNNLERKGIKLELFKDYIQ